MPTIDRCFDLMAAGSSKRRPRRKSSTSYRPYPSLAVCAALLILSRLPRTDAVHHMKRLLSREAPRKDKRQNYTPLVVTNNCAEDIFPGITTQSGIGPDSTGFKLSPGDQNNLTVSENWQGRVWGRTNCSFNDQGTGPSNNSPGKACGTGDCNGILNCKVTGDTPVTLAEFTLDAGDGQTYYDISLVDGYNLPMAIILQTLGNSSFMAIPPNLTSVSCVATAGLLASQNFNPYDGDSQQFLGTNSSNPLPFNTKTSDSDVADWCPWELQVNTPTSPNGGVYSYPDTSIQRPVFDPCYSACAKYNSDSDCCTGSHGSPQSCQPSLYSRAAKGVCPDAYSYGSYHNHHPISSLCTGQSKTAMFLARLMSMFLTAAFDDQTSTFVVPAGAGFQVIFCPGGRSTNIFSASAPLVSELANTGSVGHKRTAGGEQRDNESEQTLVERSEKVLASAGAGEPADLTWWVMGVGLALTAGIFVLL